MYQFAQIFRIPLQVIMNAINYTVERKIDVLYVSMLYAHSQGDFVFVFTFLLLMSTVIHDFWDLDQRAEHSCAKHQLMTHCYQIV